MKFNTMPINLSVEKLNIDSSDLSDLSPSFNHLSFNQNQYENNLIEDGRTDSYLLSYFDTYIHSSSGSSAPESILLQKFNLENLSERISDEIMDDLKEFGIEPGFISPAEKVTLDYLSKYGSKMVVSAICALWRKAHKISHKDYRPDVLFLIASVSNQVGLDEFTAVFADSALKDPNYELQEAAITLFEQLDEPKYLDYLTSHQDTGIDWLDEYKNSVIETLKAG